MTRVALPKGEIARVVRDYHGHTSSGEHHRYRSWEHCYRYFRSLGPDGLQVDRDKAALHLGFYLASWGMYRGSSFLLQHAYTVHLGLVDLVAAGAFRDLWEMDVGTAPPDGTLVSRLTDLVEAVRSVYGPIAHRNGSRQPTDTLVTKVILGTFGSLPACDRFFIDGFKKTGHPFSALNGPFLQRLLAFCTDHGPELAREQARIENETGVRYPIMKVADMYFWQLGYEIDQRGRRTGDGAVLVPAGEQRDFT